MKKTHQLVGQPVAEPLSKPVTQGEGGAFASSMQVAGGPTVKWAGNIEPLLGRIAASDVPILVVGETGSGKEVLARRIHALSARGNKVFLKLNCAALSSELVESAFFSSDRVGFTSASNTSPGQLELADKGTVLLDEVGDMELKVQAKLLQVLQDQQFLRVGAKEPTRVDVRIIATTHCNLETRVADGAFREDLYYRLKVVNIIIPPLRERRDEIIPLALSFLNKYNRSDNPPPQIGLELSMALVNHSWPGNIRELENAMRSYLVVRDPKFLIDEIRDIAARAISRESLTLGAETEPTGPTMADPGESERTPLARVDEVRKNAEKELILRALNSTFWNRKRAATDLGMDYRALLYKMKKLGINASRAVTLKTS